MRSGLFRRVRRLEASAPLPREAREWHLDDILHDWAQLERYFGKPLSQVSVDEVRVAPDDAFRGLRLHTREYLLWQQGEGQRRWDEERRRRDEEGARRCDAKAEEFERAGYTTAVAYYRGLADSARRAAAG